MKRVRKLLVFVVMLLFALVGCNCNGENNPPITEPTINKTVEKVIIKDTEVGSYDYKSLFTIKVGDEEIPVIDDYINANSFVDTSESIKRYFKNFLDYKEESIRKDCR